MAWARIDVLARRVIRRLEWRVKAAAVLAAEKMPGAGEAPGQLTREETSGPEVEPIMHQSKEPTPHERRVLPAGKCEPTHPQGALPPRRVGSHLLAGIHAFTLLRVV